MIFKYRVNYNGTYYEAGQDVPIEGEKMGEPILDIQDVGSHKYTLEELQDMTVREIKAAALAIGFEIKKTARDDVVNEFLEKQG